MHLPIVLFTGAFNTPHLITELESLAHTFSFQLSNEISSPAWNYALFPDSIAAITPHLLAAMAHQAAIVRFDFFAQLRLANAFSEALIQPSIGPGLFFTENHLLPRGSRQQLLSSAFSSVRQLVCSEEEHFDLLSALQSVLGKCQVVLKQSDNIPYCDLIVVKDSELHAPPIKLTQRSRVISLDSIIEAFILNNESHLRIESIEPVPAPLIESLVESLVKAEPVSEKVGPSPITEQIAIKPPISLSTTTSRTSSLVQVETIPQNFLRTPPIPTTNPQVKNTKRFIKCHPTTRLPQSIPTLLGPDQLHLTTAKIPAKKDEPRKRVLVRDEWLAEEAFSEGQPVRVVKVKPAQAENVKPVEALKKQNESKIEPVKEVNSGVTNPPATSSTTNTDTTTANTTPSHTTNTSSNTHTNAKTAFKSSFFQNLQRPK